MSRYTPGPWHVGLRRVERRGNAKSQIEQNDNLTVGYAWSPLPERNIEEHDANAHLIAAAPELLVALEDLIRDLEERAENEYFHIKEGKSGPAPLACGCSVYAAAKAAIAKARGEVE